MRYFPFVRAFRRHIVGRPELYFPLARLAGNKQLLDRDTQLVVDGYPRSGNSFAEAAFLHSQKARGITLKSHAHSPAQLLHAMGHTVTVYALRDEFSEEDSSAWLPLKPMLFDRLGPEILGFAPSLSAAIGEHDILHRHGIWQFRSRAVSQWRARVNKPVVVAPRGMLDTWAINHRRWKKRLAGRFYENANIKGAACIRALAKAETRSIRAAGFENPMAQISSGMDMPAEPCPVTKRGGRMTLLFLGRLNPKRALKNC